jgi:hypothetical protein
MGESLLLLAQRPITPEIENCKAVELNSLRLVLASIKS